ncbi:Multidrug resistance-associated protein 1 [Hypsizygus marmoreus]|uniref:Multidrug resistance-associated protein 1 n=1 Tax=Hypsizygus marmoreus TaxID=39966 RepID=A0A369K501_HYPMA|nr:Multidrug resistance-associated protein 1 [Hypsizygus marmoreus]
MDQQMWMHIKSDHRQHWLGMWNPLKPPPAPPAFGAGKVLPEFKASYLSQLVFRWISPFLDVGFSRPLEENDLWELPESKLTDKITDDVEFNFFSRCSPETRPWALREKFHDPMTSASTVADTDGEEKEDTDNADPEKGNPQPRRSWSQKRRTRHPQQPVYDASLLKALHKTFFYRIWVSGALNLFADVLRTTTPLLNKVILTWLAESYVYYRLSDEEKASGIIKQPRGIGYGIGLAIALFVMQLHKMTNHYMQIGLVTGLYLIGNIFRKSLRLSGRARLDHSVGQVTTMISTDATRLDQLTVFIHALWVSPIQLVIGFGLLIGNLGYSALVGLGVMILGFPVQLVLVIIMFKQREKGVKITDTRVRLTTEVLQGIRLLKLYAWEAFYVNKIGELRAGEIATIKKSAVASSALIAIFTFVPILASIMSFITYALTNHDLNIAVIFSSLQLFNIIRIPLIMFPMVLSSLSDALVALGRISKFLSAEELAEPYVIDPSLSTAIDVDGDFSWETAGKLPEDHKPQSDGDKAGEKDKEKPKDKKAKKDKKTGKDKDVLPLTTDGFSADAAENENEKGPVNESKEEEEKPFELKNLKFSVPKGSFVAIVGRVGSGKSSVLQALIGEMRRTRGEVVFGGHVAYVPQSPWIRNTTLRENVLFGQPDDEQRFRDVVRACRLEHDMEALPHGEHTEIGEKGINLSGGQKARVSLARAAYSQSEVVLLDDPLSAVDAYVGKAILDQCLLHGPLANRTRILVTHALHVLDKTDYIYVMENGVITEQGTYSDLMKDSTVFASLMEEYGSLDTKKGGSKLGTQVNIGQAIVESLDEKAKKEAEAALMQAEERNTGAVSWEVYKKYLRFAGGVVWAPIILGLLIANEGATVGNNLFLGFWTAQSIKGFSQGEYMAVYAGFGAAQAVISFILSFAFAYMSLFASLSLFKASLTSVLRSPISFFDTTPIGRILSRLSKDQDVLDTELAMTLWSFLSTFASVLGTVALVFYTFPLLGIIFAPMAVLYYFASLYYRRTSVETKRLDSLLRSALYSSYSETLTGLSTIRAYREQKNSIINAEKGLDRENRAYYMTITIQRWLALRLDFAGNILIFGIALFAAGFRHSVNPSKVGVVLSYTLGITQIFSEMIAQFAKNEQNMNAVERVLHYSELPPEADATTLNDPPPSWPEKGGITFEKVELAYREGLPLVLKGVSFQVNPGEKVGIVGRTGAGKSSLLQALFRTVELQGGKIEIDGRDIGQIGLNVLRGSLALVPQDSTLFLGTLRDNLCVTTSYTSKAGKLTVMSLYRDPQGLRTDAELISVLQRAWLLPSDGSTDLAAEAKFSLDSTVGDEGSNYSAGEKQLLALCRALVKNSRIIVLDEATSSVDVETDAILQRTIQKEFASSTLLCIAHRLNTIAYYDRVLVMDAGEVAEFDTVLNLYDNDTSIFRSLCNEANLQRADILRIRAEHDGVQS